MALADDIVAARADFVSYLFGVFTKRGRADSHGAPAKAPLPGSRSQAILNLLPAQLKLACGEPCHLLSIDAQLIKANANKNVSFFFILGVANWKPV